MTTVKILSVLGLNSQSQQTAEAVEWLFLLSSDNHNAEGREAGLEIGPLLSPAEKFGNGPSMCVCPSHTLLHTTDPMLESVKHHSCF